MDQRCPKICYQKKEDGLTVTACYGIDGQIYLPDELGGEPITAIAPYAFSDREPEEGDLCWMEEGAEALSGLHRLNMEAVTEIRLPRGVREIGRYAFYRCRNLRKLVLSDALREIGGGALTGCRIREVEIHFANGEQSALPSILDEMRYRILARLYYQEGKTAQVLFPEHYEEAVENTPARILYTSHHGAGGYYRQCFYNRALDSGAPINSGMGTCGLCGLIGVWTGWVSPSEEAVAKGAAAMSPTGFDWLGLILVAIVLPAILAPLINMVCRRLGWVKDGDLKLD